MRVHLKDSSTSVEGFLTGRWAGHYVLKLPKAVEGVDRSVDLEGDLAIPAANVRFFQILEDR